MQFLIENSEIINLLILIGLAIFLFKKLRSIDYVYFFSTFIGALWDLVVESLKFKNGVSYKDKLKNFYYHLPNLNKSTLGKNILIFYIGCLVVGIIEIIAKKVEFSFLGFFIDQPGSYFGVTIVLIFIFFILKFVGAVIKSAKERGANSTTSDSSFFDKLNKKFPKKPSTSYKSSVKKSKNQTGSNFNNTSASSNSTTTPSSVTSIQNEEPKMKQDSTSRIMCSNCVYWTGSRQFLSAGGNFFQYEDKPAKCSPNGGRPNTMMQPRTSNLPCFQKWG